METNREWLKQHAGNGYLIYDVSTPKTNLAFVYDNNGGTEDGTESAANLIASAPVLLQALKACSVGLIADEDYYKFKPLINTIEAALRAAEGKTK